MTVKQEVNKRPLDMNKQNQDQRSNRKWALHEVHTHKQEMNIKQEHTIWIIWQKHIPWWGARFRAKLTICFLLLAEDHHSSIVLCCAHACCEVQYCWAVRCIDSGLIATCNGDVDSWWVHIDLNKTDMSCSVHVLYSWGNTVTLNANWPTRAVGWSSTQCLLILWTRSLSS